MAKIVSLTQYFRFNFSSAEWRAGGRSSKYISRVELLTDIYTKHSLIKSRATAKVCSTTYELRYCRPTRERAQQPNFV